MRFIGRRLASLIGRLHILREIRVFPPVADEVYLVADVVVRKFLPQSLNL